MSKEYPLRPRFEDVSPEVQAKVPAENIVNMLAGIRQITDHLEEIKDDPEISRVLERQRVLMSRKLGIQPIDEKGIEKPSLPDSETP